MLPTHQGAIRLFRLAGINVFLHWSWFVIAIYEIQVRRHSYGSIVWNAAEYLAVFAIVTLHEFGHSLACRQVGGKADQIVLWPLGGVAYVSPPQRPGATLWSIAAGPLVNVLLIPVFRGLGFLGDVFGWAASFPDVIQLLNAIWVINIFILIFNVLPVYPLDGGQILRSLLWFVMGRAHSLTVASTIGFLGVLGLGGIALLARSPWIALLAAFVALNCWRGFQEARILSRAAKLPRRHGFACPSCRTAPPIGAYWICETCRNPFDAFETNAVCPYCRSQFAGVRCLDCGGLQAIGDWSLASSLSRPL
jgi:Zn-dependent protease